MRTARSLLVLVLLAVPIAAAAHRGNGNGKGHGRPAPVDCPADIAAALAEACPCDTAPSHGRYVSCIVRFRTALRRAGCLTEDANRIARCAARSTCGRSEAVLCCVPSESGGGVRISRDAASCEARSGTAGGTGSVCGACIPTTTSSSTSSTSTSTSTSSTTSSTAPSGFVFGNAVEFAGASVSAPGFLLGGPVTVPAPVTLTHLCLIGKSAGPNTVMALYRSDSLGRPAGLVAATAATPVAAGRVEIPVTPTALAAGTYWLTAVFDVEASVGLDESDATAPVRYVRRPWGMAPPNPFGTASGYNGQRFNYYLLAE